MASMPHTVDHWECASDCCFVMSMNREGAWVPAGAGAQRLGQIALLAVAQDDAPANTVVDASGDRVANTSGSMGPWRIYLRGVYLGIGMGVSGN
ncbi:conserved hypothetical protein [Ricinus communis]|uniref:Uncharacterized protein n=1 Tax=Ricinus communis TaxID=3988 RepID=B9T9N8_RICCO|nr:conserved hypothetical protein [Ricinus communis]